MADVFLSYKREDARRAAQFAKGIEAHGYSTFFDAEINVGESWTSRIEQELAGAKCVVVLWSKHSKPTDGGKWVHNEARNAMARSVLAPALIDECEPPVEFSGEQAAKLMSWRGDPSETEWKKLVARIAQCVQQPPKPVSAKPWLRRSVLVGGSIIGASAVAAAAGAYFVPRLTGGGEPDPLAGLNGPARDVAGQALAASAEAETAASQANGSWQSAQESMLLAEASPQDSQFEVGTALDGVGVYRGEARRQGARAVGVFTKAGDYTYGGEWEGSLFRGLGKKEVTTPEGIEKHSGRFVTTVLNGRGVIEFADGAVYKGDLAAGVPHGVGVLIAAPSAGGAHYRFVGAFVAGKLEGYAVEYGPANDIRYTGRWRNGLRVETGAPQMNDEIASLIEGARQRESAARQIADQGRNFGDLANEYAERARSASRAGVDLAVQGLDHTAFPDWGEYAGQIRSVENALGHFRAPGDGMSYSGGWSPMERQESMQNWAAPTFDGFGVYNFPSTSTNMRRQAGRFDNCCQSGQGEIVFADGRIYRGDIVEDIATGLGVTTFPDGRQHVGNHTNGLLQGLGVEFGANGEIARQGNWNVGVFGS